MGESDFFEHYNTQPGKMGTAGIPAVMRADFEPISELWTGILKSVRESEKNHIKF